MNILVECVNFLAFHLAFSSSFFLFKNLTIISIIRIYIYISDLSVDQNIVKSDKGGDIVLHPAVAVVAAGARGLPTGWACLVTLDGYFIYSRNILWGC